MSGRVIVDNLTYRSQQAAVFFDGSAAAEEGDQEDYDSDGDGETTYWKVGEALDALVLVHQYYGTDGDQDDSANLKGLEFGNAKGWIAYLNLTLSQGDLPQSES